MVHYVILHHLVVDWPRQVATSSGKTGRQLYCTEIGHASYNVVNWHSPGFSLTPIGDHASLSAPFRMILVSTAPSTIQGTRTSFRLEKSLPGCGVIAIRVKFATITSRTSLF